MEKTWDKVLEEEHRLIEKMLSLNSGLILRERKSILDTLQ